MNGTVSLVGAGPGDPELLTLAAARALAAADVVVHDRLVPDAVLDLAPVAERVPVGKWKGGGSCQEDIHATLVGRARRGQDIVRLKGGDPFLFGRGAEEVEALAAAGVPYRVVPGISSALAAPLAAGVAVTRRGVAAACTVLSGHMLDDREAEWAAAARLPGTLVVLMAATTAARVARRLLLEGRRADEPVAVVHAATLPHQQMAIFDLSDLAVVGSPFPPPVVLVIGEVAAAAG